MSDKYFRETEAKRTRETWEGIYALQNDSTDKKDMDATYQFMFSSKTGRENTGACIYRENLCGLKQLYDKGYSFDELEAKVPHFQEYAGNLNAMIRGKEENKLMVDAVNELSFKECIIKLREINRIMAWHPYVVALVEHAAESVGNSRAKKWINDGLQAYREDEMSFQNLVSNTIQVGSRYLSDADFAVEQAREDEKNRGAGCPIDFEAKKNGREIS